MSSTTYYFHCEHCKPDQETCTEQHFRPCGGVECRGKRAWKTVTISADGTKNKTTIHTPPVEKKAIPDPVDNTPSCWESTCTTACSKDKCWFEARDEGESLGPDFEHLFMSTYLEDEDCDWGTEYDDEEFDLTLAEKAAARLNPCFVGIPKGSTHDPVNHPAHYTSHPSGIECIEITQHYGFNIGNCIKYLWREGLKGSAIEDLSKAAWYLNREIEKRKAENN